jgi:hypothetical protein
MRKAQSARGLTQIKLCRVQCLVPVSNAAYTKMASEDAF